jgi:hypothetical protein
MGSLPCHRYATGTKLYAHDRVRADPSLVLKEMGMVAAVDCVLNNWDRVPMAHNNEGNVDNWIIDADGSVRPIDQGVSPIKMEQGRVKYLERLRAVRQELLNPQQVGRGGTAVAMHLENCAGIPIPSELRPLFLEGLAEGAARLGRLSQDTYETLKDEVVAEFTAAYGSGLRNTLHFTAIDPAFLSACTDALCGRGVGGGGGSGATGVGGRGDGDDAGGGSAEVPV